MLCILRYEKLPSAETNLNRFGYAVHWWNSSILWDKWFGEQAHNYTKVDYSKLIPRAHREKAELLAADSQRLEPWQAAAMALAPATNPCVHWQQQCLGSRAPWPPGSITVIALFKGHTWLLILNGNLILRDQKMLFAGPEELSGKVFIKGTSLNF